MKNNELFEGITFLKDLSLVEFFMFFVYVALILIGKFLILFLLRKVIASTDFKRRVYPVIEDVLNWLLLYGGILFFLFYFSKEQWLTSAFYETEGVEISVLLIIVAVLIVTFASRVTKALNRYVMPFVYEQFNIDMGMGYTINRLLYYVVMFLALAISFTTVGLDLTALGFVFSVLGIGIGFGVRNIAANFVSGIIILFERPMEVGEMVEIDGKIGRITKIKLRSTVIETLKEGTLVVPNQYFIEQIVKNRSSAQLYARVVVSVEYGSDTKKIEQLLKDAALKTINLMKGIPEKEPDVRFINFRNSALDFQVEVQVADVEMKERLESRIRHAIAEDFVHNNVKMAQALDE
ncbi:MULTISPECIES: mechanosensitive ion channel domain-containing protein [Planococcus]|uniref:mechanosensitive ion channel family protein n=1 Tax=Planococcus TaxID=1372 RepID=UPI0009903E5F|nr:MULTISPECIES: mechanosensitive ion channel domain-containing protein [Planococcus]KAA0956787.1 mechanosensitive ion channel [Planococcus sp. ANT_H30]MDJ0332406.1 mechanosensitive ion channel [Planococcus sp. S3-L1]